MSSVAVTYEWYLRNSSGKGESKVVFKKGGEEGNKKLNFVNGKWKKDMTPMKMKQKQSKPKADSNSEIMFNVDLAKKEANISNMGTMDIDPYLTLKGLTTALLALSNEPSLILRILPYFHNPLKSTQPVILFECGPVIRLISNDFLYNKADGFFIGITPNEKLQWLALINKAVMTKFKDYFNAIQNEEKIDDIFMLLTGVPSRVIGFLTFHSSVIKIENPDYDEKDEDSSKFITVDPDKKEIWIPAFKKKYSKKYEKREELVYKEVSKHLAHNKTGVVVYRQTSRSEFLTWSSVDGAIESFSYNEIYSDFGYDGKQSCFVIRGVYKLRGTTYYKIQFCYSKEDIPTKYDKNNKEFWDERAKRVLGTDVLGNPRLAIIDARQLIVVAGMIVIPRVKPKHVISYKQISLVFAKMMVIPFTVKKKGHYISTFTITSAYLDKIISYTHLMLSFFKLEKDPSMKTGFKYTHVETIDGFSAICTLEKELEKGQYIAISTNQNRVMNFTGCLSFHGPGKVDISYINSIDKNVNVKVFDILNQMAEDRMDDLEFHKAYIDTKKKYSSIVTYQKDIGFSETVLCKYAELKISGEFFAIVVKNVHDRKIFVNIQYKFCEQLKELGLVNYHPFRSRFKLLNNGQNNELEPEETKIIGIFYYSFIDEEANDKYIASWIKFIVSENELALTLYGK